MTEKGFFNALTYGIAILVSIFVCLDCSLGESRISQAKVQSHIYIPPSFNVISTTDNNGNPSTRTVYHPEEFHLVLWVNDFQDYTQTIVSRRSFYEMKDGDLTVFHYRVGRWTNLTYGIGI